MLIKGYCKTYRNLQLITAQLQKIKPETKLFRECEKKSVKKNPSMIEYK